MTKKYWISNSKQQRNSSFTLISPTNYPCSCAGQYISSDNERVNGSDSPKKHRTLDQYYYYMLPDTEDRDRDQVVFRHKRDQLDHGLASKEQRQKLKKIKVIMVDQL
jgi:hypothetical protein